MLTSLLGLPYPSLLRRVLGRRPPAPPFEGVEVQPAGTARGRLALPDDLVPVALKHPAEAKRRVERLARERFGPDTDLARDVSLFTPQHLVDIPHDRLWQSPAEKIIEATACDLVALLDTYRPESHGNHIAYLDKEFFSKYLYMNVARVLNLHCALLRKGFRGGTVLEIGSYFGSFSLALQRLGYQVTAVDRYGSYGEGFAAYTDLMAREGVRVVATRREDERGAIEALGPFDCVLSAAVIEHIPHTPREFLRLLTDRARPGGLLCLDTPNLTRWWNRLRLCKGETIFQDLKAQYHCEIPYEGHHREYTGDEMVWMMGQLGCADVELTYFDYNMFQFRTIDRPHIECLLSLVRDPSLSDTILVCGRLPGGAPPAGGH
jgi:2-polyprenyl-3-methyl-5-hydroxy-6-metoxy-1,4-benzoquinol methylase